MGYISGATDVDNEKRIEQAERQRLWRRLLLAINGVTYFAWIGSQGLHQTGLFGWSPQQWSLIQTLSWPIWATSLAGVFVQMAWLRRNRQVTRLIDDERTAYVTRYAYQGGYWGLLLAVAAVYAATFFTQVDARVVLPLLLATGVTLNSFIYAWLYRG
ncbi:MAG: hypothetical protein LDL37_08575 [Asticcacaulis sp.]|uniref:hypothetical protein n=1 Tax=Asticcacaulis sp. TaxID=1872648 RepID=UPI0025C14194|nr:hypothetical protein [Asticcacaulis sp.]MCA1935493.1 hypothetical protein [Asticcacaulis sp.]